VCGTKKRATEVRSFALARIESAAGDLHAITRDVLLVASVRDTEAVGRRGRRSRRLARPAARGAGPGRRVGASAVVRLPGS
jgi:hypothetical protein